MASRGIGLDLSAPLNLEAKATLLARLQARTVVVGQCWVYRGTPRNGNHRAFSVRDRPVYVHQLAYAIHHGPIPAGWLVCHACDNPPCWRPEHLFLGTHIENLRDMWAKGRATMPPVRRGLDNHAVTKADDVVAEARRLRSAGVEQREIARRLGVSQSTVWRWAHRRTRAETSA